MTDIFPQAADVFGSLAAPVSATEENFHSSGLRAKVDQLMDILWAGGVNNPMDAVEQISYLLFLRLLSENDDLMASFGGTYRRIFAGEWARRSWDNFVTLTGDGLYQAVRDAIENLYDLPGMSATGRELFNRAALKIYDRPTLRTVIQVIAEMPLEGRDGQDLKGDMYEYLLSKLSISGTNGQFRTPRHIIQMIVALVDPQPRDRICDPACGTAGFLVAALEHLKRAYTSQAELHRGNLSGDALSQEDWKAIENGGFTGYDNDANMVKIAILNLYLHNLEKARLTHWNPLTASQGTYPGALFDIILANPPFAGKINKESILSDIALDTRNTELLFLKWFMDHLRDGGKAGIIVPNGVLFGSTGAAKKVRELLLTTCDLQAVINLPSGVFKPYSGVGTAVLIFEKGRATELVWFYDLTADGFSLDDKRTPIAANDIPDVLARWPGRAEGPNAYRVSVGTIRENADLSLSGGRYRQTVTEAASHDAPRDILLEVMALEARIIDKAEALAASLG